MLRLHAAMTLSPDQHEGLVTATVNTVAAIYGDDEAQQCANAIAVMFSDQGVTFERTLMQSTADPNHPWVEVDHPAAVTIPKYGALTSDLMPLLSKAAMKNMTMN